MHLLTYLRTLLKPRPVAKILNDANALVEELRLTAEVQEERSARHRALANLATAEAERAKRVAGKISELVS